MENKSLILGAFSFCGLPQGQLSRWLLPRWVLACASASCWLEAEINMSHVNLRCVPGGTFLYLYISWHLIMTWLMQASFYLWRHTLLSSWLCFTHIQGVTSIISKIYKLCLSATAFFCRSLTVYLRRNILAKLPLCFHVMRECRTPISCAISTVLENRRYSISADISGIRLCSIKI